MAQWQQILRLDLELQSLVTQLYEDKFPRWMRHFLCVQIESNDWCVAASDEDKASACFCSLLDFIEDQWKRSIQENNMLEGPDFAWMRDFLLTHFQEKPKYLATILSECLMAERKILDAASEEQNQAYCRPPLEPKAIQLDINIKYLNSLILGIKKETKSIEDLCEGLEFIQEAYRDESIAEGMRERLPVEQRVGLAQRLANVEQSCRIQADTITQKNQESLQNMMKVVNMAEEIVLSLVDVELPEWKRRQQLACVGCPVNTSLDHLQNWFTSVSETLLDLREQLQKLQQRDRKSSGTDVSRLSAPLEEVKKAADSLIIKLLNNALVVEKQPVMSSSPQHPLIVKTGVRFSMSVRFLANPRKCKFHLKVKPEFDKDVEEAKTIKGFRKFSITNNKYKVLDEDTPGGGLVAEFCHMSLKEAEAKAKSRGTTEAHLGVTEELHLVKFVADFWHPGLDCTIEASSLPVVVISSSNQVASAWASIMWCSMLCTSQPVDLSLFVEPPAVPWTQLSQLLSWQFLTAGQRELDPDQLAQLREKFLDGPDELVEWSRFSKGDMSWIWIDGILELIKKHLLNLWKEGLIMGFVSKKRAKELLQEKENGTFLLRFSESKKEGAVTFSWVERVNDKPAVHSVLPYTKEELSLMGLADLINLYSVTSQSGSTSKPLLYLYPHTPKDAVFERHYSVTEKSPIAGYVFRTFVPTTSFPTPPPSPPSETLMDLDPNMNFDVSQQLQELFPEELFDFSESSFHLWSPSDSGWTLPPAAP